MTEIKMTEKQKRFCEEYIKCWNGAEAARRAGYSPKSANRIADENLSKPYIKNYIAEIKEQITKDNILTAEETLSLLSDIAKGNTLEQKEVVLRRPVAVKKGSKMMYEDTVEVIEVKPSASVRKQALDSIGKYHSLFTDNHNVYSHDPVVIIDDFDDPRLEEYMSNERI